MSKKTTQPIHSSKQLSSPESRAQKQRNIVISSLAFLVLIAVGTVFVIMNWDELRAQRSVATANGDRISLRDLEGRTRYERYSLIRSAEEFYQYAQILGPDQSVDSYIAEILNQIEIMLAPETIGQSAMDHLIEDRLIRQEAGRRGLVVTEGEIEKALQAAFGFYLDGTPTPLPTWETIPTSTLSPLQQTLIPPTQVLTPVETMPSPALAVESMDTQMLTSIPFSEADHQDQRGKILENIRINYNLTEANLRSVFESYLYQQKVMEAVLAEQSLDRIREQVWVRHILVSDNQELLAQDVYRQLENGADFCVLAAGFSIDIYNKDNCGDLGWSLREQMVPEFRDVAFSLQVGAISQPVKSMYGWHLIQNLGHEKRQLSQETYNQLREQAFAKWLQDLREKSQIEIHDFWKDEIPAEPDLPPAIKLYILQVFLSQPEMVSPASVSVEP